MATLAKQIEAGESKTLEFKERLPSGKNLAKSVIAFSNTGGGKLLIGIEDRTGKVRGVDNDDLLDLPDKIANIIYESCYPAIIPEIYVEPLGDKQILVVKIFPGALRPYYLKSRGKHAGTYLRIGATNKPADMEMLLELERQRRNCSFDEEVDYNEDETALDLEQLGQAFKGYTGKLLDQQQALNLKLLVNENGHLHPTTGGLLLAGRGPFFEYARIRCARFKGCTLDEYIDEKEFTGPLHEQVEAAMRFAQIYIAKRGKVQGLQRIDRYEIPLEAVREILVNAVVHRDYSISGSDIKLAIFDDRLEVLSPGMLPSGLSVETIQAGRSEIRNKVIARFFREINFIEQWGTGIRKIIHLCQEYGLPNPAFIERDRFFKVHIFKPAPLGDPPLLEVRESHDIYGYGTPQAHTVAGPITNSSLQTPASGLTVDDMILSLLRQNPRQSAKLLATRLGKSPRTIERKLAKLKEQNRLRHHGPAKGGRWEVIG
jgi:ATP-dependent DNA helicase RecG